MQSIELSRALDGARILVVGGAGFVGSRLVHRLAEYGAHIVVVDNLLSAERDAVPTSDCVTFVESSITDDRTLENLGELDFVFHLATYHGNQSSIANPLADHENNLLPSLKLFDALRGKRLNKLVYAAAGCASAEKTFDEPGATPETDTVSVHHDSPYQISKLVGEMYASYYHRRHGLPAVRARFQNVYGPGETLGAGQWRGTPATVWRNVVPTFIYRGLRGLPLTVENEGVATRDFIFVEDLVDGLLLCAGNGEPGEAYNLARGREVTIRELAIWVQRLTGERSSVEFTPAREWDRSGRRFGSTKKATRELGFSADTDIETGLRETVAWTEKFLERIEKCIQRHEPFMRETP